MEKIVEFNNIQTLAALASVKLAGSKILFLFKYYFLLMEFKLHEAPAYTCSLQDQLARNFTDKAQTIHPGASP